LTNGNAGADHKDASHNRTPSLFKRVASKNNQPPLLADNTPAGPLAARLATGIQIDGEDGIEKTPGQKFTGQPDKKEQQAYRDGGVQPSFKKSLEGL
jgi:hypothetical protein